MSVIMDPCNYKCKPSAGCHSFGGEAEQGGVGGGGGDLLSGTLKEIVIYSDK